MCMLCILQKKLTPVTEENEEEEEDAFELLFKQLEEDLKNDDLSIDDIDDEISEEDMALLERELEGVLGDFDGELLNSDTEETPAGNEAEKTSKLGNDDLLNLRTWQLNKLARALKTGRRKMSVRVLSLILICCLFNKFYTVY